MVDDLARYSVTARKSFTVHGWHGPYELARHYWRGVVDGDGTIGEYESGRRVQLIGSYGMMSDFQKFIKDHLGFDASINKNRKIFVVAYNGKEATQVAACLYGGATIYLDRKFQKAHRWAIGG
jgi:hypothetical protein